MLKYSLSGIFACAIMITAQAQYVHYDPMPNTPPPAVESIVPQSYMLPPPRYFPPVTTPIKPTVKLLSAFLIKSAIINGKDYSQHYINGNAGIAIYTISNQKTPFMAVVVPGDNSNSNGSMIAITSEETPQTATSFGRTTTLFSWDFINSGDGEKGSATVTLVQEYRKEGTVFSCHIVASNGKTIDFAGMVGQ